jgi:hypothetical protein
LPLSLFICATFAAVSSEDEDYKVAQSLPELTVILIPQFVAVLSEKNLADVEFSSDNSNINQLCTILVPFNKFPKNDIQFQPTLIGSNYKKNL